MTQFKIFPRQGFDDVKFGMGEQEVQALIGPPNLRRKEGDEVREYRYSNALQLVYAKDKGLVEVGFSPGEFDLFLGDLSLFSDSPAATFQEVVDLGDPPKELHGFVVLMNTCMTFTGLHDGASEQRAVTAFAPGRWDGMAGQLKDLAA